MLRRVLLPHRGRLGAALLSSLILAISLAAAPRSGVVLGENGVPIPAVSVVTDRDGYGTQTDSLGRWQLELDTSILRLTFSAIGWQPRQLRVTELTDTIVLQRSVYEVGGITVRGERAERGRTPVTHTNLTREEIVASHSVGDVPLVLNQTPNVYVWSDAGGNLGYTYAQIRGFDDKRLATYLNGVPLNDPEDQYSYWVDIPDVLANTQDIQVQRGVGNSLYGDASFGGSINVVTSALGLQRGAALEAGFGRYLDDGTVGESYRQSVEYRSGLIDGRWSFYGRFSNQRSDGYRRQSWARATAYYLTAARIDPNMVTEFHVFGGPMKLHLSFFGISRDQIAIDRRFNPLTYAGETDNFSQPHYHLHNRWTPTERVTVSNTLYYIRGRGHFDQRQLLVDYSDYNFTTGETSADSGSLVQRRAVAKYQLGWNPRLDIVHDRGRHSIGGSFYYFESDHEGKVVWASNLNEGVAPNRQYYGYFGRKRVASIFAQEEFRPTDRLTLLGTLQLRYQDYRFNQEVIGAFPGYRFQLDWTFLSPRLGATYRLTAPDQPLRASIYANAAIASRAPTDLSVYPAFDPSARPSLQIIDTASDGLPIFGDPTFSAERVYNIELGADIVARTWQVGLNVYRMDFTDEIVPQGGIDPNSGQLLTANADDSYRMGVELQGQVVAGSRLRLSGNLSLNRYRIERFVVDDTTELSDQIGPNFPSLIGNGEVTYTLAPLSITGRLRTIGKRYIDIANTESFVIDPYTVVGVQASVTLPNVLSLGDVVVTGRIDNLFDEEYELSGYTFAFGGETFAEYFVAAKRSFYLSARVELF